MTFQLLFNVEILSSKPFATLDPTKGFAWAPSASKHCGSSENLYPQSVQAKSETRPNTIIVSTCSTEKSLWTGINGPIYSTTRKEIESCVNTTQSENERDFVVSVWAGGCCCTVVGLVAPVFRILFTAIFTPVFVMWHDFYIDPCPNKTPMLPVEVKIISVLVWRNK